MLLENFIKTDRLILKNLTLEDANGDYLQWLQDPSINQFLEVRHRAPNLNELKSFVKEINCSDNNLLLGIHLLDGKHIGNIKLGPIHPIYARAMIGLLIGDKTEWGKGYASEAIHAVTEYAFENLKLLAVWAGCYATNLASCKAFLKVGYMESCRQPQYWKINDKFIDNILFVKFRNREKTYS